MVFALLPDRRDVTGLDGRREIEKAAARPAEASMRSVARRSMHLPCQIAEAAETLIRNG